MRPRTTTGWSAAILGLLLVASNAWWLYFTFDNAITASYRETEMVRTQHALDDALAIIPALDPASPKGVLVADVERLFEEESFEKDGCVWVGSLGLRFNEDDRLDHVSKNWNSGESDPCFPE